MNQNYKTILMLFAFVFNALLLSAQETCKSTVSLDLGTFGTLDFDVELTVEPGTPTADEVRVSIAAFVTGTSDTLVAPTDITATIEASQGMDTRNVGTIQIAAGTSSGSTDINYVTASGGNLEAGDIVDMVAVFVGNITSCSVSNVVLPVELTYFRGKFNQNSVLLEWETATEVNNEGFEVQKSTDAKAWKMLDFVKGAGNTVNTVQYAWEDENPAAGISYYRLKQMDFDGAFEYSPVVAVDANTEKLDLLSFYPNPAKGSVLINSAQVESNTLAVDVFDAAGRVVKSAIINAYEALNIEDLTPGTYTALIKTDNGRSYLTTLVVQ